MRRLVAVLCLVVALPAVGAANDFGPVHHTFANVYAASGSITLRDAVSRRFLGLINDGAAVAYCKADGDNAAASEGIRLAAAGTTGDRVFFDRAVPIGPLRCMSSTNTRVLIIEGR